MCVPMPVSQSLTVGTGVSPEQGLGGRSGPSRAGMTVAAGHRGQEGHSIFSFVVFLVRRMQHSFSHWHFIPEGNSPGNALMVTKGLNSPVESRRKMEQVPGFTVRASTYCFKMLLCASIWSQVTL